MVLNSTQMTVLQSVNIALGTTAFVALTSNLSKAVTAATTPIGVACLMAYVAFLIFWVAKIFIQNHVSFSSVEMGSGYRIFQLFITIGSFLLLIVACQELTSFKTSSAWLLAHFSALPLWLVGLAIHLGRAIEIRKFPWHWAVVPVTGIATILALRAAMLSASYAMLILAALMFFPAIYDARVSRTFVN